MQPKYGYVHYNATKYWYVPYKCLMNATKYGYVHIVNVQYLASITVEGCQAGGLGHLLQYMCEYVRTMPRAQNRTAKGSTLK